MVPSTTDPSGPARRLLAWYDRARRPLPWRETRDPWAIWVSEVMLQQTRVETALGYFLPFLERFPDPEALATAPESDLLARWSGLGYYRRARQLRQAATRVVAAGGVPRSARELRALPGIGDYTAAAIASIAFGEVVPVVDGNVLRVGARLLALEAEIASAASRRAVRALAATLLDPARPGDSNQALMELGATLCVPRRPRCPDCPLRADCRAAAGGDPARFPLRRARAKPSAVAVAAAAVEASGRLLLVRRGSDEALLPGLWELPACEGAAAEPAAFARRYGGRWTFGRERACVRHTITTRALTITLYEANWQPEGVSEGRGAGWYLPAEALALPLTGAARKLIRRWHEGAGAALASEAPRALAAASADGARADSRAQRISACVDSRSRRISACADSRSQRISGSRGRRRRRG